MKILRIAAIVLSVLVGVACSPGGMDDLRGNQGMVSLEVALDAEQLSADDVAGLLFQVFDGMGDLVEEVYVPLEEEPLPGFILPGVGDNHAFSDAYFVLVPGEYSIIVTPMQDPQTPSEICQPAYGEATVVPNDTVEVVLIIQCDSEDTGGLDIIGVLNHEPVIVDLVYDPTKFVYACEQVCVTVHAEDVDNDPLSYTFELIEAPDMASPTLQVEGNVMCFIGNVEGTYRIEVTVEDGLGGETSLIFPIHVSGDPVGLYYQINEGPPICIEAFANEMDAATFYSYNDPNGASANTGEGFERSSTVTLFVHEDPAGNLGMFFIFDRPNDGSGGEVTLDIDAAAGMLVVVKDDPGDYGNDPGEPSQLDSEGDAVFHWQWWPCCTDGGVIGYFATGACITFEFLQNVGVNQIDVVSGNDKITTTYSNFSDIYTFCLGY